MTNPAKPGDVVLEGEGNSSSCTESIGAPRYAAATPAQSLNEGCQTMETAPANQRLLVHFMGAGQIVAYRDEQYPEEWVRFLGYGKSHSWPTVHSDYATAWRPLGPDPTAHGGLS